jgi:D-ribose pyranose/furanose isomerase RbsD
MKEVEISQNWEKLHKELSTKYYELEKKYNLLKIDHDKLKRRKHT